MPRQLAVLIFTAVIVWMWRADSRFRPPFSKALWIPLIWLLILGSRPLSWWLWFYSGISIGGSSDLEGSPLDRLFYMVLIVVSAVIVSRRGITVAEVIRRNWAFSLFYGLLACSILWSDFPFPTLKRWIKEVGAIPVLLIILTEEEPLEAVKAVFTRCAFVLFAFSVMVVKYFPEIGRDYSSHSGTAQYMGIAQQKNSLGEDVAAFGLVLVWQLVQHRRTRIADWFRSPSFPWMLTIFMGLWLFTKCDSKTSIICFALGTLIVLTPRIKLMERYRTAVMVGCVVVMPLFYVIDQVFDIYGPLLRMLGRNPTLTNRTEIWDAVKSQPVDPLLGCGYLTFWDKFTITLGQDTIRLKTAHNGYLETYLDVGILGLIVLTTMLISLGRVHARAYISKARGATLGLSFFLMTLMMNISETLFARRSPLWSAFLLVCVGAWLYYPGLSSASAASVSRPFPASPRKSSPKP